MTPTLVGRWQTRAFLMALVGLPLTWPFARAAADPRTPYAILAYVLILGLVWDWIYQGLQRRRWDGDWPPILQLAGGIAEGALVWVVLQTAVIWAAIGLEGPPLVDPNLALAHFAAHYATVWLAMFVATQGPLRILFPRWRFAGGRIWGRG